MRELTSVRILATRSSVEHFFSHTRFTIESFQSLALMKILIFSTKIHHPKNQNMNATMKKKNHMSTSQTITFNMLFLCFPISLQSNMIGRIVHSQKLQIQNQNMQVNSSTIARKIYTK